MSLAPSAMRRLMRELATFRTSPPDGLRLVTSDEDILDIVGIIAGPEGTPYEGGYFRVKFQFTEEFPAVPPKCTMMTKIFHPNVSKSGEICVNTLKKDWKREYGIAHILVTIRCLLIYPNAESALDEAAGKLLLENYDEFSKHARMITSVHATPRIRPAEFDVPSAPPAPSKTSSASARPVQEPSSSTGQSQSIPSSSRAAPSSTPSISDTTTPASAATISSKPVSKSGTTSAGLLSVVEVSSEPLQLSPSNNIALQPSTTSSSLSRENGSNAATKENGMQTSTSASSVTSNGPLQPAASENGSKASVAAAAAGGLKRPTGAVGGVAKRKKGLKRL